MGRKAALRAVPASSGGRSLKAAQSATTRDAILSSSLRLFAKQGFVCTSIDQIATAAGITKGAVYWHFDSKDALFDAILESIRARWRNAVLKAVAQESPAASQIQQLFAGYSALFRDEPDICFFMQRVLLEEDDRYSAQIARVFQQTARFIAGILDRGKASGEFRDDFESARVAHFVLGGIAGATQQHIVAPSIGPGDLLEEAKRMVLARVSV